MYKKYDIDSLTTSIDIEMVSSEESTRERNRFRSHRRDLKSALYKYYFYDGFFDSPSITSKDREFIQNGFSPIRTRADGSEYTVFTVHHIQPLICGGKTLPRNLIPLPRGFHDFIHEKLIDPQIHKLKVGDKHTLVGLPDFSKVTLDMMCDIGFRMQLHKHLVDKFRILPISFVSKWKGKDSKMFNEWYKNNFDHLK